MNYSRSMRRKRQNEYMRRLILSWLVCFVLGIFVGTGLGFLIKGSTTEDVEQATPTNFFTAEVQEAELAAENIPTVALEIEPDEPEPKRNYLGNWCVTAYCACEKCCGEWANKRPDGIVKGAEGVELQAGVSVASPLPFGTRLYIEGYGEYVVQDRTASWVAEKYNNEIVDIYFDNHEAACSFGKQYLDIYEIESEDESND